MIPFLHVCAVDRVTLSILGNVVSCFYTSPPPFTWQNRQLDLEHYNAKTSTNGTTNSFILPQMSTLAVTCSGDERQKRPPHTCSILALMSKRFVPKFTKQSHVRGMRGKNVLPTHVQDYKSSWTSAEPRCYPPQLPRC